MSELVRSRTKQLFSTHGIDLEAICQLIERDSNSKPARILWSIVKTINRSGTMSHKQKQFVNNLIQQLTAAKEIRS